METNLKLKNDLVFKAFFSKKGNEKYLKSFLESLLKIEIDEIEIIGEATLLQMTKDAKLGRIDIKATINKREIVNIEIQLKDKNNMEKRSIFYGAKLITDNFGKKEEYKDIKPVILINILNYNLLKVPEYCTKTVTVAEKHREYEVIKDVTYYFIELPKFRKSKPKLANKLECWLALIDDEDRGLIEMAKKKEQIIEEANKEVEEILSEAVIKEINDYRQTAIWEENSMIGYAKEKGLKEGLREGREQGIKEGRKEGIKEGKNNKAIEIAKNLKEKHIDIKIISETTGLTKEEIEKL